MSIWRFLAYLLGAILLFLSKGLIPLALYGISRIFNLPEHTVTYLLGKGPPVVTALIFILFGLDLLRMKLDLISNEAEGSPGISTRQPGPVRFKRVTIKPITTDQNEKRVKQVRIFGGWLLILGLVFLLLSLSGPLTEVYSDNEWPPLPYP